MSKQNMNEDLIETIQLGGKFVKIYEMFESFTGWYWFTTVRKPYPDNPDIRYGYVVGFEKEWGTFDVSELKHAGVWTVPKMNWSSNSNVELVPSSKVDDMEKDEQ
jgi:hypothetical protein